MNNLYYVSLIFLIIIFITSYSFQINTYRYSNSYRISKNALYMYDGSSVLDKPRISNAIIKNDVTKKAFYNRYTQKMFFVDTNISDILLNNNQQYQSFWKFKLLSIHEIDNATSLVVDSHYKSFFHNHNIDLNLNHMISKLFITYDKYMRDNLYNKVLNGFLSRSYSRLHQPTLDYHYESLILAAYHDVTNELLGIVELYPTEETYLCNLAIHHNYRRIGLASALCKLSEEIAYYAWNSKYITLHVEKNNNLAINLYEKLNYYSRGKPITIEKIMLGESNLICYKKKLEYLDEY